jgi:hypothetical protein
MKVTEKAVLFQDVTPCSVIERYRRFRGTSYLDLPLLIIFLFDIILVRIAIFLRRFRNRSTLRASAYVYIFATFNGL